MSKQFKKFYKHSLPRGKGGPNYNKMFHAKWYILAVMICTARIQVKRWKNQISQKPTINPRSKCRISMH